MELFALLEANAIRVNISVVCAGPEPGPAKDEAAKARGK